MAQTVREFLREIADAGGHGEETDAELAELLEFNSVIVWHGEDDVHRWYILRPVVVEFEGRFIRYHKYILTGEYNYSDMDLSYDLDKMVFVEPKTRQITETYYVDENEEE